jgi:hypothetical protein
VTKVALGGLTNSAKKPAVLLQCKTVGIGTKRTSWHVCYDDAIGVIADIALNSAAIASADHKVPCLTGEDSCFRRLATPNERGKMTEKELGTSDESYLNKSIMARKDAKSHLMQPVIQA